MLEDEPGAAGSTYCPGPQTDRSLHALAFWVSLYLLAPQLLHIGFAVAVPGLDTKVPARHAGQAAQGVVALPSSSQVPLPQAWAGVSPPGQNWPEEQRMHTGSDVGVAGEVCTVPTPHMPGVEQAGALVIFEVCPFGQGAQTRSRDDVGVVITKLPGAQSVQVAQSGAFWVAL